MMVQSPFFMKNERLEISSHCSSGLDVCSQCQRTCFGLPSSKSEVWAHLLRPPARVVPRAFRCSIQDRVSSASSLTQPWKTNKNLGFYLLWELPTLPPGECHSQQTLESNEILSAGEEESLWLALRSSDCNTRQPCAGIHSSNSFGMGPAESLSCGAAGESKTTSAMFFFLFSRFACEKTCV